MRTMPRAVLARMHVRMCGCDDRSPFPGDSVASAVLQRWELPARARASRELAKQQRQQQQPHARAAPEVEELCWRWQCNAAFAPPQTVATLASAPWPHALPSALRDCALGYAGAADPLLLTATVRTPIGSPFAVDAHTPRVLWLQLRLPASYPFRVRRGARARLFSPHAYPRAHNARNKCARDSVRDPSCASTGNAPWPATMVEAVSR